MRANQRKVVGLTLFTDVLSADVCVNRHGGNPESTEANPPSEAKTLLRVQVESFIRSKGLQGATSDEIEASTGLPHQTISPRLTELKSRGYVVPGERRITRSGSYARALVHIDHAEEGAE